MKTKVITLAVVVAMLSVCFAGIINYSDDVNAISGDGKTESTAYDLGSVKLSELKDKAVVYFNLSYDKQFASDPTVAVTKPTDTNDVLTVVELEFTDYRYSANIMVEDYTKVSNNLTIDVFFTVNINYNKGLDTGLTESVYYKTTVIVLKPADNPNSIEMEFQGNIAYNGNWTLTGGKYTGSETGVETPLFKTEDATFYSNNLPAGLYLKKISDKDGATIVGMIGSSETSGTFDVYTVTENDVTKTTVTYGVVDADEGKGFEYRVADGDTTIIEYTNNIDRTVLVKAGTELTLTTRVDGELKDLTEVKVTNSTNDTYDLLPNDSDGTYTISSPGISGTVKVFMTYNNGINDNTTIELTIIYIGSPADASLVNPVVRSY